MCSSFIAIFKSSLSTLFKGEEEEHLWESTYDGVLGGVTTVVSELNEPIHMVATRGVLLWKELDTRIFALPAEKR